VPELRLNQDSAVQTHVAKDLPSRRAPATQADSCDADRMRSDGRALPDLTQTIVLRQLGLIRTDQLPDLAARWLAADMTDTPATRMLAGHNPRDPWKLDQLLAETAAETGTTAPTDLAALQEIAVDWVTATWEDNHDTRAAIATLARLGVTYPDFDLGLFIGLDDEWNGGWGRLEPDLQAAAEQEIDHILHDLR